MSKGSAPAGNTTVTQNTVNPTQAAQIPYLTGQAGMNNPNNPSANFGWNQAVNLASGDPFQYYPAQTLANFNSNIPSGYQGMINEGANVLPGLSNTANNAFANGVGGGYGVQNSPAYGMYQGLMNGANAPFPEITNLNNLSAQAIGGNAGTNQLAATANGSYLNNNPYIAGEYASAAQPVVNAYQTATAPQTDSNFEASGRYESGALANAQSQNQLNLGTTLGNLSANLYGQDYANERGLQTNAASQLGSLTNQQNQLAQSGQTSAGNLLAGEQAAQLGAANGLQSGFQAGNTATNQALLMEPNVLSGNLAGANAMVQGGQGLTSIDQAQITDAMNRFYGNQQAPWTTNTNYLNQIGQPTSGSSNAQTTQPYFQNQTANLLGAGVGGLGLFNGLNSATGGSLSSGLSSALGGLGLGSGLAGFSNIGLAGAAGGAGVGSDLLSFLAPFAV